MIVDMSMHRTDDFAAIYASKLKVNRKVLAARIWDHYFDRKYDTHTHSHTLSLCVSFSLCLVLILVHTDKQSLSRTKKIFKNNKDGKYDSMFVQFVLTNIWQLYQAVIVDKYVVTQLPSEVHASIPPLLTD
jgi:hypothetical protein